MSLIALKRFMQIGMAALLVAFFTPHLIALAADASVDEKQVSGELDGLDFRGELRSVDGSISLDDTLHFRDGYFWSTGCTKCSFMPGTYWTRRAGDAIEFRGILKSPERGQFTYQGAIQGGKIQVTINWRRERWYWTLDRDYVFEGRANDTAISGITLDSARMRAAGEAPPTCPI